MNRSITAPAPAIALGRLWTIVPVWLRRARRRAAGRQGLVLHRDDERAVVHHRPRAAQLGAAIVLGSLAASVIMSRPSKPVPIFDGEAVIADSLE
ncbi:MAG: hypothetical protein AB7V43_03445 [Acidimicrobiia bacterium]